MAENKPTTTEVLDRSYDAEEIFCLSSIGIASSPQFTSLSVSMLEIPLRGCVNHNFDREKIFSLNRGPLISGAVVLKPTSNISNFISIVRRCKATRV